MVAENRLTLARTRESRERAIAALSDHFAHDAIDVDEFERRVTVAQTSESPEEIEALLSDLGGLPPLAAPGPAAPSVAMVPAAKVTPALVAAADVREQQTVLAIMGGVDRRGSWTVPRRLKLVAVMGGAYLDLREARFPPGPVDIEIFAFMGGLEIIVPPGLAIETHGSAIMGGFQQVNRSPPHPDEERPLLRVHGFVMMGGVDIRMQLPGESGRDADRRQRRELREQRKSNKREHKEMRRIRGRTDEG
jgi:hypothetical protein